MKKFIILLIFLFLFIPECFAKEKINVAVNIDNKYTTYALLTFNSILKNNKSNSDYTFYVLHDGLSFINKLRIKWFIKKHKQKVEFVYVDIAKIFHNNKNIYRDTGLGHITSIGIARIFIPELLPETVKKCIYIDCDTLVVADLKELWDIDISQYAAAMCEDPYQILYERMIHELDMYYNSGVILMNVDYIRKMDIMQNILAYTKYYLINFTDQDALNIALNGHIKQLDQKWNYMYGCLTNFIHFPNAQRGIIHYITPYKPWIFRDSPDQFKLIELYYSYWKNSDLKFSYLLNRIKTTFSRETIINYYGRNLWYYYADIRSNLTANEHPKISVIVPVYNGEEFIDKALSCFKKQTFKNFEVIFVNDGSMDKTPIILENKTRAYGNFKVIHHRKNQGAGAARNTGLAAAKGDYVIFLDIDDEYDKNLLKKLYQKAIKTDSDITICDSNTPYGKDPIYLIDKDPYNWKDIHDYIYQSIRALTIWNKLYKRNFLLDNNLQFTSLKFGEDVHFVSLSVILADKITTIPDNLIHYNMDNPNSLTKQVYKAPRDSVESWILTKKFLDEKGIYKDVERSYLTAMISSFMWAYYRLDDRNQKLLIDKYKPFFISLGIFDKDFTYYYAIYDFIKFKEIMGMYPPSTIKKVKEIKSKLPK